MTNPWPADLRFEVDFNARDGEEYPPDDESLGRSLFQNIHRQSFLGPLKPQLLVFFPEIVEHIALQPTANLSFRQKQAVIAGLVGRQQVELVALICGFAHKGEAKGVLCFLEWPDNRWWHGWQVMEEPGKLLSHLPIVSRAIDGKPKPGWLGGWFSRSRRHNLCFPLSSRIQQTYH